MRILREQLFTYTRPQSVVAAKARPQLGSWSIRRCFADMHAVSVAISRCELLGEEFGISGLNNYGLRRRPT